MIALVLVAAVLLGPRPSGLERPAPIPARTLALHAVALPGVGLPTPFRVHPERVQSLPRTGSESSSNPFRVDPERVRDRFRVGSEYEYGPAQGVGTNAFADLRTPSAAAVPIDSRRLVVTADPAPAVFDGRWDVQGPGHLSRGLATAAEQTSAAFRIAGRAVRSVF
jgi:hypothetical protein